MEELAQEAHARVGSTFGKYRLDAVLGVGGTAAVYAGTHRNGNRVAIKVLHSTYSANEQMRARFLREGYVANKVDHPGTVRVLDDESASLATYLVMDLLEGETLDQRASRIGGKLPLPDVVHHAIALLDVLERAHVHGIVHRDIKPENVFFTTQQQLKILDFGIARLRDGTVSATKTQMGTMLGTPAYLSPEQAVGRMDEIDARTDIWAVGATLFTLITGRHVHQGRSPQEALVFASTRPAPPLKSYAPQVPDQLAHIIDRALRFNRLERWPSATEMKNALIATGLARITVAVGVAPAVTAKTLAAEMPTMMTTTASTRVKSSTGNAALAGALFGIVTLCGIVAGLIVLKHRESMTMPPPPTTSTATSKEEPDPEPELLPLPTASAERTEPAEPIAAIIDAGAAAPPPAPAPAPPDPLLIPLTRERERERVPGHVAPPAHAAAPKPIAAPPASASATSSEPKDPWDPRSN